MTLAACAVLISGATAEILPAVTATSIARSIPFFGSITCPPFSTRSYCAVAAVPNIKRQIALRMYDALLDSVPRQVLSLSIRLDAHFARYDAIVAEHAIALQRLIGADGRLEVPVMQSEAFRTGFLMRDGLHVFCK